MVWCIGSGLRVIYGGILVDRTKWVPRSWSICRRLTQVHVCRMTCLRTGQEGGPHRQSTACVVPYWCQGTQSTPDYYWVPLLCLCYLPIANIRLARDNLTASQVSGKVVNAKIELGTSVPPRNGCRPSWELFMAPAKHGLASNPFGKGCRWIAFNSGLWKKLGTIWAPIF